ncbi:benzoate-CoA ligase family protein [Pseudenhygromyxa sp. WMMC2535]|uniref:benzoate-CoA ligase family protein n=1 Tax=Pseudenhygromyxa sp. WMMC2535 TaxID=2712867 RepID=UPI001556891A|nr:benzoate-CoA ligase family protein [Pseudenhygromyxa sp. WMMC2535]NVB40109.1 benzoate-CoA ligase family protein [Pseudenhygromyxa sp. WMMC2535]
MIAPPRPYRAVDHFIERHLREGRGDKIAYIDERGQTSYRALAENVRRAAGAFEAAGVMAEQRVVLCMRDTADFVACFFGAMAIGAVPVPVNTLLTAAEIRFMLADSRARAVVVSAALWERVGPATRDQALLHQVFVNDTDEPPAGTASLRAAMAAASPEPRTLYPSASDEPGFWLYSSGSTGQPKGVVHTASDLETTARLFGEGILGICEDDLVLSAAKLFFAYGLGNAMSFPLHVGATTVLHAGHPTPQGMAERFAEHEITLFFGVPTLYATMLASPPLQADSLRLCVSAGEALVGDLLERWRARHGVDIIDGLGSTEMLHIFLSNRPGDVTPGATGLPVPGYEVKLVDEHGQTITAADEVGELWVEGPTIPTCYWNQRAKSLATFVGTWARTGDKYVRDANGRYRYAGRADDMLKVGGIWVSPFEIEAALASHPEVLEAAVIGQQNEAGLIKPKAFVVLAAGKTGDDAMRATLKAHCKAQLAPYKYPRWFDFVDELPKTATGKVQRFKLREG